MTNVLRRLREKAGGAACAAALAGMLALGAGQGIAAEWQVRLPVQKTARIAPQGETAKEEKHAQGLYGDKPAAKSAEAVKPAATKEAPTSAPKTALGRAAEAAAVSASPKVNSPAAPEKSAPENTAAAKSAGTPVGKPADTAVAKPEAKPLAQAKKNAKPSKPAATALSADPDATGAVQASTQTPVLTAAPAKAAKPAPAVVIDPKAKLMPPAPAGAPTPLVLPANGKWVGDVDVEFQAENIVLHAATNTEVERVTWFNLNEASGVRKLAVDLRGPWRKKGASVLRFDVGPVKHIVVGEHEDRLRLSVEFRSGAVTKELDPVLVRGAQGFNLTIPLAVRLAP